MTNYWIGVAAYDHVQAGVENGLAQLGHGKASALKGLNEGDWIVYYSPRTQLRGGEKVQAFTALGQIVSHSCYQVLEDNSFHPYRVDVDYQKQAALADIRPLLSTLQLTRERGAQWGLAFRRSRIKICADDFKAISVAMGVSLKL